MKTLQNFLLEGQLSVKDMKSQIISSLNGKDLTESDIKKMYKICISREIDDEAIDKFLTDRGIIDVKKSILRTLYFNDDIDKFADIISNPSILPTSTEMVGSNNIYNILLKLGISNDSLQELANLQIPLRSINRGPFEILSCCFLQDISKENKAKPGKSGDVNCEQLGSLEYKGNGGRIMNQNTPAAKIVDKYFQSIIKSRFNITDKYSILNNQETLIKTVKLLMTKHGLDKTTILEIIAESMISMFEPEQSVINDFIKFVKSKESELINDNGIIVFSRSTKFTKLWGTLDMYAYKNFKGGENFDKMIVFKKNAINTGEYILIDGDEFNSFDLLYNDQRISFSGFPKTSNVARESVMQIHAK